MKKQILFGSMVLLFAAMALSTAKAYPDQEKLQVTIQSDHAPNYLIQPVMNLSVYYAEMTLQIETHQIYASGPPAGKEIAELPCAHFNLERCGEALVTYNNWSPRTGSYYYLMGKYKNPGSKFRS
jgi:hypothetical protein